MIDLIDYLKQFFINDYFFNLNFIINRIAMSDLINFLK